MGKSRSWNRVLSALLIVSILLGLAPTVVWAEAANKLGSSFAALRGSWDTQEAWVDGPYKTENPQYYTFSGEKVLEERPDDLAAGLFKHRFSQFPINLVNCISNEFLFQFQKKGCHIMELYV